MITRAFLIFIGLAVLIYLIVQMVMERGLSMGQVMAVVKTAGVVLISATLSGMALIGLLLADKLF